MATPPWGAAQQGWPLLSGSASLSSCLGARLATYFAVSASACDPACDAVDSLGDACLAAVAARQLSVLASAPFLPSCEPISGPAPREGGV